MASIIENVAVVVLALFLAVWGTIRGDVAAQSTGLGLLGVKAFTFAGDHA